MIREGDSKGADVLSVLSFVQKQCLLMAKLSSLSCLCEKVLPFTA